MRQNKNGSVYSDFDTGQFVTLRQVAESQRCDVGGVKDLLDSIPGLGSAFYMDGQPVYAVSELVFWVNGPLDEHDIDPSRGLALGQLALWGSAVRTRGAMLRCIASEVADV